MERPTASLPEVGSPFASTHSGDNGANEKYVHIISLQLKSVGESLLGGDKFAPKQTTLLDMVRSVSKVVP